MNWREIDQQKAEAQFKDLVQNGWTIEDAVREVKVRRPSLSDAFMEQLRKKGNEL